MSVERFTYESCTVTCPSNGHYLSSIQPLQLPVSYTPWFINSKRRLPSTDEETFVYWEMALTGILLTLRHVIIAGRVL